MFIKSTIVMLVTAGFAGSVVYYGIGAPQVIVNSQQNSLLQPNNITITDIQPAINNPNEALEPVLEPAPEILTNLAQVMPMLMSQADNIGTIEIKDQAYLDVVNFSVRQRQYRFADAAMLKISQTELRDTARGQMAIALAMDGRAVEAFDIIDTVEIDALRDVMRLQVIEAMIVPESLPEGLLRK